MRLKRCLKESSEMTVYEALSFAVKNCSPFLKEIGAVKGDTVKWIYSGRNEKQLTLVKKIRIDRKPTDTPKAVHELLDNLFYKKFGIKSRSNSVFATSSPAVAASYGHSFLILPMGKFTFLYNPLITDLYNRVREIGRKEDIILSKNSYPTDDEMKVLETILEKEMHKYTNKDLKKGITARVEIMVQCKEYFAIDSLYESYFTAYFRTYGIIPPTPENLTQLFDIEGGKRTLKVL